MSKDRLKRTVVIPLKYTITVDGGNEVEREKRFRSLVRWVRENKGATQFGCGSLVDGKKSSGGSWSVDLPKRRK